MPFLESTTRSVFRVPVHVAMSRVTGHGPGRMPEPELNWPKGFAGRLVRVCSDGCTHEIESAVLLTTPTRLVKRPERSAAPASRAPRNHYAGYDTERAVPVGTAQLFVRCSDHGGPERYGLTIRMFTGAAFGTPTYGEKFVSSRYSPTGSGGIRSPGRHLGVGG
jgi:hypothetical protein